MGTAGIYATTVTGRSVVAASNNRLGYTSSTERIKENILPISVTDQAGHETIEALPRLWDLQMVGFDYIKKVDPDQNRQYGVIAEQAHDLGLCALVYYEDECNPSRETIDGFSYERHSIWLQAASKIRFEELEARIAELENQLAQK